MKAIDLFSGAGGLSLGLRRAGFELAASVEIDACASATHKRNFPNCQHFTKDVREIDWRPYRNEIDLVAGGPPCQPFSVSGKQQGREDVRDMVPEFIRAVTEIDPKAFMLENVKGLTTPKFSQYLQGAIRELESLGYYVISRVLNAADYGVPQVRERIFIVGMKQGFFMFPQKTHGTLLRKWKTVAEALVGVPADEANTAKIVYCKNPVLRKSPYAGLLLNGKGRPLNPQAPSLTIPASAGGNRTHFLDPRGQLVEYYSELMRGGAPRTGEITGCSRLTVRESARLQSFPDDFEFLGAKSRKYAQIGNAVPPLLAEAVATQILQSLNQYHGGNLRKQA